MCPHTLNFLVDVAAFLVMTSSLSASMTQNGGDSCSGWPFPGGLYATCLMLDLEAVSFLSAGGGSVLGVIRFLIGFLGVLVQVAETRPGDCALSPVISTPTCMMCRSMKAVVRRRVVVCRMLVVMLRASRRLWGWCRVDVPGDGAQQLP